MYCACLHANESALGLWVPFQQGQLICNSVLCTCAGILCVSFCAICLSVSLDIHTSLVGTSVLILEHRWPSGHHSMKVSGVCRHE